MIRLSKFLSLFVSKKADKERVKGKNRMKYYTKDNIKFVTWKYDAGVPCFYLNKSVDIVNALLLNDSRKLQGFFCKGYFVKNILKKNKKKFLPGNFYQFLYKLVYIGYKIENGERLKMYQLKEIAYFESV